MGVFAGFALVATLGMAFAAVTVIEDRAEAHALRAFAAAGQQLERSLALRYQAFEAVSDLSYVMDVVRQVTQHRDRAEFGLASADEDREQLRLLHESLVDASWDWARATSEGFFAITDYKARVVYSHAMLDRFGGDASSLSAVAAAYRREHRHQGAMVVRGDDPRLLELGLVEAPRPEPYVVFARATVLGGEPRAVFVQGVRAARLLEDVALLDDGMRLLLVGPDGSRAGELPPQVVEAGLTRAAGAPMRLDVEGRRWLVQRHPLPGLAGGPAIASLLVARDLRVGLAALRQGASVLWGICALLFAVAGAVAMWLARRLAEPVVELEGAARRVQAGELDTVVPVRTRDELGRLAAAFNQMTAGLRERERIERTFKKYMAPEVVDYLLSNPGAQSLGGERRRLTILFTDLVGFTAFSEALPPEEVVARLNVYLSMASERIAARGGTLDKYLGDAVMAFFGAPLPREDHAARACLAALDQLEVVERLAPRWAAGGRAALAVRIGVNTGEVVLGNVGGEMGQEYTVIGDAVNLASRLEGANKEYGTRILVSEATFQDAGDAVVGRELDLLRVKGKSRPVRVYELLGPSGWAQEEPSRAALLQRFGEGLLAYRAASFQEACAAFEGALRVCPQDKPSSLFLARSRALAAAPPPGDWDGVFTLDSK